MGKEYKHSGNVDWGRSALWLIIGMVCFGAVGVIYGLLAHINPIIYLHLLLLFGVVFVMSSVAAFVVHGSHARNKYLIIIMVGIMCVFAWYCGWCMMLAYEADVNFFFLLFNVPITFDGIIYYANNIEISVGRRSASIPIGSIMPVLYIIEFAVFLYPIYTVAKMKHFFCEACKKNMSSVTLYYPNADEITPNLDALRSGNALFLKEAQPVGNLQHLGLGYKAYEFNFHFCLLCKSVVVNVERISISKNDKGKIEIADNDEVVKGVYLDKESAEMVIAIVALSALAGNKQMA